jgi:hypothetical protein
LAPASDGFTASHWVFIALRFQPAAFYRLPYAVIIMADGMNGIEATTGSTKSSQLIAS